MKYRGVIFFATVLLVIVTLLPLPILGAGQLSRPVAQTPGANLLANPGFEGEGLPVDSNKANYGNWTRDTFNGVAYGEIFSPQKWVAWWQEGDYRRPECKVIPAEGPFINEPKRIYQGYYSAMCFTFYGKQNGGYYQVVNNVAPGSVVQASFYAHAWACGDDEHDAASCSEPYSFAFHVGIDPTGGTDPFSSRVVWSNPYYYYDKFGLVGPVQATVGQSGSVTIFLRAHAKWQLKHNDAYFDNPSLVLVSTGTPATNTPQPPPATPIPQPTSNATPLPQVTPTPRPDGAVTHKVVEGDTLFGIALTYNVDLDELRRLNAGTLGPNDMLSIDQEVIISTGPGGASPTPTPQAPAQTPIATPGADPGGSTTPGQPGTQPQAGTGNVCVTAYDDKNSDMLRQTDGSEPLLPGAKFNLVGNASTLDYTTDGMSEPYCFQNVPAGNYILRHMPPQGYKLTDAGQWNVALGPGQISNIDVAYLRDAGAVQQSTPSAATTPVVNPGATAAPTNPQQMPGQPTPTPAPATLTSTLNSLLRIAGFVALGLAVAIAILFVISRRTH